MTNQNQEPKGKYSYRVDRYMDGWAISIFENGVHWLFVENIGNPFEAKKKAQQIIDALNEKVESWRLKEIVQSLSDWDKKYPKGRVYAIGENDPERQLDLICEKAHMILGLPNPPTNGKDER